MMLLLLLLLLLLVVSVFLLWLLFVWWLFGWLLFLLFFVGRMLDGCFACLFVCLIVGLFACVFVFCLLVNVNVKRGGSPVAARLTVHRPPSTRAHAHHATTHAQPTKQQQQTTHNPTRTHTHAHMHTTHAQTPPPDFIYFIHFDFTNTTNNNINFKYSLHMDKTDLCSTLKWTTSDELF